MSNDATRRQQLIEGLRALADFYEQNPTMPLPQYPDFRHCVPAASEDEVGQAEVRAVASALGVPARQTPDGSAEVDTRFAGLPFHAFYVSRQRGQQWRADMQYLDATRGAR